MSTVEASLDPKVPMWDQPKALDWRPDNRRIDGRTSDGKFTKTLLAAGDYDATLVIVDRPWNDGEVRPVEAVRLVLKADVYERLEALAIEAVRRGLVSGPSFNVIESALVSTSGDWYMHDVTLIESKAVCYHRTDGGEVQVDMASSGFLNAWTRSAFPVEENPHQPYTNEWYNVERIHRTANDAVNDVRMHRWQDFKVGEPMKFLTGLIEKADARDVKIAERQAAIEALKDAQPLSAMDKHRLVQARKYIDEGVEVRGWVDEDAINEMEHRWVSAQLKRVIELAGKTTLEVGLDHIPYSWRLSEVEEAFVINVDTAIVDVLRRTTRDGGTRRTFTADLLFRFTGTFIEVLSGR